MAIPASLQKGLILPIISAPMFLVSGPDLVVEACNAGVIGTFPSLNQRTTEGYRDWIHEIKGRLKPEAAAFGVNHICLLYTSPSPRDLSTSRMPSSA